MHRVHVRWVFPLLIATLYFFRNIQILLHPTLFAEEGVVFLPRVIYGEWDLTCSGYLNTFTYIGIWAVSNITVTYLPHVLFGISFLVNLIPFFYFLLPHWEKLLPYSYRVAFCVLVLILNPWHESMCQFLYCFWYLGLGAGLLAIEQLYLPQDARRWRWGKIAFAVLAGLSGPVAFTLGLALLAGYFAAIAVQCLLSRSPLISSIRSRLPAFLTPVVLCILITGCIQMSISFSNPETRQYTRLSKYVILYMPIAAFIQLHVMLVVSYLLPYKWVVILNPLQLAILGMLPFTLLLLALPLFAKKSDGLAQNCHEDSRPPLSWMLGFSVGILFALVYAGRTQIMDFYKQIPILSMDGPRYSILQGEIFVLFVVAALSRVHSRRIKLAYIALFSPLLLIHGIADFQNRQAADPVKDWNEIAPLIVEFKNGKHAFINEPTRPSPWTVILQPERMKPKSP